MNRFATDFLTSTNTFWGGAGTILNIRGNYYKYNSSSTPAEADAKAIYHDWAMIGQDMKDAIDEGKKKILLDK
jgi:hypothetical protein